jgi:hypothetical protein
MEPQLPARSPLGTWVQTEREAHEAWAALITKSPLAAKIMHLLAARVGDHNAVVISQGTLAQLAGATRRGVQKALAVLERGRWLELRQIGQNGTVNAYVLNDRVAWSKSRDGLRYSLFSAIVIVSDDEQPDKDDLGAQPSLRRLPALHPGDQQLPTGPGMAPPAQPSIDGLEPDLPALRR